MQRIKSLAALSLAMAAGMALAFPLTVEFENNAWRPAVEPETSTILQPYAKAVVVIRDADILARVLSNMEALNTAAGWVEDAGLLLIINDEAPVPAASPVPPDAPIAPPDKPPESPAPADPAQPDPALPSAAPTATTARARRAQ